MDITLIETPSDDEILRHRFTPKSGMFKDVNTWMKNAKMLGIKSMERFGYFIVRKNKIEGIPPTKELKPITIRELIKPFYFLSGDVEKNNCSDIADKLKEYCIFEEFWDFSLQNKYKKIEVFSKGSSCPQRGKFFIVLLKLPGELIRIIPGKEPLPGETYKTVKIET